MHPPAQNFESLTQIDIVGRDEHISLENVQLFPNLKFLILINTNLTWKAFFSILPAFGNVNEFILCKNELTDYENIDVSKLKYLSEARFINLEETALNDFSKIQFLGTLSRLQKLILNMNPLPAFGRGITGFEELKHLSVQNCAFVKPVVLFEISAFKNLESLNVKHNIIGDKLGNAYVRMRAVAEISKLNQINGALLKKYERKDC
jgi:hypothetical protein